MKTPQLFKKCNYYSVVAILSVLSSIPAHALAPITGWCEKGGVTVVTGSSSSSNKVQGSYPQCIVTVYLTGSGGTLATLYSTVGGQPLSNPFTSTLNGFWEFFAANGHYDIQLSGGGLPAAFTTGDIALFDFGWTLPSISSTGCWVTNTPGSITLQPCLPAGNNGAVQFNNSGAPGSDTNFSWSHANGLFLSGTSNTSPGLTVNGTTLFLGTINVPTQATFGGGKYNSITEGTSSSGALLSGIQAIQSPIGVTPANGGYIQLSPVTYNPYNQVATCYDLFGNPVYQPLPLSGGAFGANDAVLWVSTSPTMPSNGSCGASINVNEDYGLNLNTYFLARGGLATDNTAFNAVHALLGGMTALSYTAGGLYAAGTVTACCGVLPTVEYLGGYIQIGHSVGPPSAGTIATVNNPLTAGDGINQGTMYWDDSLACVNVYNGTSWGCIGSGGGGGGSAAGANTQVQFNNAGNFGASANLTWASNQLSVVGTVLATVGLTNTGTAPNAIQAPSGGYTGKWSTVSDSTFWLEESAPALGAVGQAKIYADSTSHQLMLSKNNGAFVQVATNTGTLTTGHCASFDGSGNVVDAGGPCTTGGGGGTVSAATKGSVAFYTTAGTGTTVGGTTNLSWNNTTQALSIISTSLSVPALVVNTGYVQSDGGLLATNGVANAFNSIQAPSGGMEALSFTAANYIQSGQGTVNPTPTTSDTFHAGAMYYNTTSGCEEVYNGYTWACMTGGGGGGTPGGGNTNVQFNNSGSFGGSNNFEWNNTSQVLTVHSSDYTSIGSDFIQSSTSGGAFQWIIGSAGTGGAGVLNLLNATNSGGIDGIGTTIKGTGANGQLLLTNVASEATGSTYAFQLVNNNFIVDGNGNISTVGNISLNGPTSSINITSDTAYNSIQTVGGINLALHGGSITPLSVNGNPIINSSLGFVGNSVSVFNNIQSTAGGIISTSGAGSFGTLSASSSTTGNVLLVLQTGSGVGLLDLSAHSAVQSLEVQAMPTSCSGQPSKTLWNNSGVVNICP